ncbi:hypothetical protein SacxiDRAFT_1471 [Saccharomonospora xinjiangensis XJ-54]|uniref:Uncharacterized protein n=1 Tax=Saccharomonospora xinjiangensis XJ-54 TaxID=882086 RepID=I0V0R6_9PSEU|nr:hypothetical protein SacxiDRAFT_1471 [Saccharomonospora xinjiangensis XJ-54]
MSQPVNQPQAPGPIPPGQSPQQQAAPASPRRGAVVLAAVAGLVLGGACVGGAWWLTSGSSDGAEADAAMACEIVARAPRITEEDSSGLYRWGAASGLAKAAAEVDSSYREFASALEKPLHVFHSTFEASGPEFDKAMREAKAACADRP